ncbi:MAG TPA: HD domain-containing protein [Kofleriaceae bacterium]|nr:HD domain-containing protein [Kofleriaceae bacterium]
MRDLVAADPATMLDVAASISEGRGEWPPDTISRACADVVATLGASPGVRLRTAMERVLMGRDVDAALEWLHQVGALRVLFPELEATVDLQQESGRLHKDVWAHTKQVVKQAVRRPDVRWAAMLHDIGKVPTRTFTAKGVHFHGHAEVGARMFDKVVGRVPFDRDQRSTVRFLIKHHLRSNQYSESWTDSAVRRFAREMQAHLVDLLDLSRADITSKRPGRRQSLLAQISALSDRIDRLAEADAKLPPLPSGVGNAIMEAFRLPPSKLIGDLKKLLEAQVSSGELEARREDEYYVAALARQKLVPGLSDEDAARIAAAGGLSGEALEEAEAREAAGDFDEAVDDVEAAELLACKDDCDDPGHDHGR